MLALALAAGSEAAEQRSATSAWCGKSATGARDALWAHREAEALGKQLARAALQETNAIALIELLEMLWSCDVEGANAVIDAVLQRLQQLRALR